MGLKRTFTIKEVAEVLSCSPDTIRKAIRSGHLKAAKLGKDWRISMPDLELFFQSIGGGQLFESEDGIIDDQEEAEVGLSASQERLKQVIDKIRPGDE